MFRPAMSKPFPSKLFLSKFSPFVLMLALIGCASRPQAADATDALTPVDPAAYTGT